MNLIQRFFFSINEISKTLNFYISKTSIMGLEYFFYYSLQFKHLFSLKKSGNRSEQALLSWRDVLTHWHLAHIAYSLLFAFASSGTPFTTWECLFNENTVQIISDFLYVWPVHIRELYQNVKNNDKSNRMYQLTHWHLAHMSYSFLFTKRFTPFTSDIHLFHENTVQIIISNFCVIWPVYKSKLYQVKVRDIRMNRL